MNISLVHMRHIIGVDFDNTIVNYDNVIYKVALQEGLISENIGHNKSKKDIRDAIRKLPDGEIAWQKIQSIIYGPRMNDARLMDGVQSFFVQCKNKNIDINIVSHKTVYAGIDGNGINLREATLDWMEQNDFFKEEGMGLAVDNVFFEPTRQAKIERIRRLGCTHFIDDLEETFVEESFPKGVKKILYDAHENGCSLPGIKVISTWSQIGNYIFDENLTHY